MKRLLILLILLMFSGDLLAYCTEVRVVRATWAKFMGEWVLMEKPGGSNVPSCFEKWAVGRDGVVTHNRSRIYRLVCVDYQGRRVAIFVDRSRWADGQLYLEMKNGVKVSCGPRR